MMSGGDNPEAAQKQQAAEQLQFADAEAEVRKKNASAMKDEATAAEKMAQPIYQ